MPAYEPDGSKATPSHPLARQARRDIRRYARRAAAGLSLSGLLLGLPGCAMISGTTNVANIRLIDASPDAGGLDVYQGSAVLAYNLGLGTLTSYVPVAPGNYGIVVDAAGTRTQITSATGTFLQNNQYTVLIGNLSNSLQELILKDQTSAAPTGQISLRVLDQSTRAGTVDLYLVPSGSTIATVRPVLTDVAFGQNTGYFNVPTGTYTLVAVPTGVIPTASTSTSYTGSSIAYGSGVARTFVLIDQQVSTMPGLQVIIANDYDSPSATS